MYQVLNQNKYNSAINDNKTNDKLAIDLKPKNSEIKEVKKAERTNRNTQNNFEKINTEEEFVKSLDFEIFDTNEKIEENISKPKDVIIENPFESDITKSEIQNETFFSESENENINVIGEIFDCYIIVEYKNEMILIDKHAAHERLLFEKLKKSNKSVDMQNLLEPIVVTLDKSEYSALIESQELISDAGFLIDDFGEGTVIVRSVPMYINLSEVSGIISEIASYILNNKKDLKTQKLDWLYHNIACRSAIKAGKESSKEEILELVKNLILNPDVSYCPHGRPIFVSFTKNSIEKKFGRI